MGDLILRWKGRTLEVEGLLSTEKEQKKLKKWADAHEFEIKGDLKGKAEIIAPKEIILRGALMDFLEEEVGEVGYAVYAISALGKGHVVKDKSQLREAVEKGATKVRKMPAVAGG